MRARGRAPRGRAAELRRLFDAAPITRLLGHRLLRCRDGVAEVALGFRPGFEQGQGVVHGGIVAALADTAGYFAAASVVAGALTTAEFKVNLVGAARGEDMVGRAEVVSRGRTLVVCRMQVTGGGGGLVALAQGTYYVLPPSRARDGATIASRSHRR